MKTQDYTIKIPVVENYECVGRGHAKDGDWIYKDRWKVMEIFRYSGIRPDKEMSWIYKKIAPPVIENIKAHPNAFVESALCGRIDHVAREIEAVRGQLEYLTGVLEDVVKTQGQLSLSVDKLLSK